MSAHCLFLYILTHLQHRQNQCWPGLGRRAANTNEAESFFLVHNHGGGGEYTLIHYPMNNLVYSK